MTSSRLSRPLRLALTLGTAAGLFVSYIGTSQAAPVQPEFALSASRPAISTRTTEVPSERKREYARIAEELNLGKRQTASQLLTRSPSKEVRLAAGERQKVRLAYPIQNGSFVRGFGFVRKHKKHLPHNGVDIAAKTGTPIHAAADGIVAYANNELKGYGNIVMIVHPDGAVTSYAHCSKLLVVPGQRVKRGEVIAEVGSTGISQGPHLHFEYRVHGRPKNPMAKFDRHWFEREQRAGRELAALTR
jgi:murein DD-endopeptidase MepM/ murein hydrolase activator NlpD